jgi:hypothetical protein
VEDGGKRAWLAPSAIIGLAGLLLTAIGLYITSNGDEKGDGGVAAYQEQIRAACTTIFRLANLDRALAVDNRGLLDKTKIVAAANENLEATKLQFDLVERLDAPKELQGSKARFQKAKTSYLTFGGNLIATIDRSLPPRPTPEQYEAVVAANQKTILPASVEINAAMTELAGGECRVA